MISAARTIGLGLLAAVAVAGIEATPAEACINYYGTSIDGRPRTVDGDASLPVSMITDNPEHHHRASAPLGPAPADNAPFEVRSNYAASLLYHGAAARAVPLLEAIEREHPGEYTVAANLGTAYELAGNDRQALRWIAEGVKRNPGAHEGTEWLHVRILEAKLALASDPAWLTTHSVLGLDFGAAVTPSIPTRWPQGHDLPSTLAALRYQLRERIAFVAPPDPIVADLVADYARLVALDAVIEEALPIYDLALAYHPARADAVERQRDALAAIVDRRELHEALRLWGSVGAGVAVMGTLIGLLVIRRRRRSAGSQVAPMSS